MRAHYASRAESASKRTLLAPTDMARVMGLVGEGLGLTGVFRAWRAKIDIDLLLALLAVANDGTERRKLVEVFRRPR